MILDRNLPPAIVARVVDCDVIPETPAGPMRRYRLDDGRYFVAVGAGGGVALGVSYRFGLTGRWARGGPSLVGVIVDRLGDTEGALVGRVEAV